MKEDDEQETVLSARKVNFLVPDKIEQVILLPSELSDEMTPVQRIISAQPEVHNVELKPLKFAVDEKLFDDYRQKNLQTRGLLQIQEESKILRPSSKTINDGPDFYIVPQNMLLLFATKETSKSNSREKNLARTTIFFDELESVFLKKGLISSSIVFKVKPERKIFYFHIDPIEREFSFSISRQDIKLAEQYLSLFRAEIVNSNNKEYGKWREYRRMARV